MLLSKDGFIVTAAQECDLVSFNNWDGEYDNTFRSFSTLKGDEYIETKCFNFIKWIIPTIISLMALTISIITLIISLFQNDIVKVTLIQ